MGAKRVVVAGGGPAGFMAAGQAAQAGAHVRLLEKMHRPALKLSLTGKGRCNITNIAPLTDFITHFGRQGNFLRQAFWQFFTPDLIQFFEGLGLPLVTERGGRVFPESKKASDVGMVLTQWINRHKVDLCTSTGVEALMIRQGAIKGVISGNKKVPCHAVVLATGGASYPATGSTGDGYPMADAAGHRITPIRPALVPLETAGDMAKKAAGLNLRNIHVRLMINGKQFNQAFGEMTFTEFGVSGPVILTLSGEAVDALGKGQQVSLSLDLKPALDPKKLDARLLRDIASRGKEEVSSFLRGLMPRPLVPVCLHMTEIPANRRVSVISAQERRRLRTWLKDFQLQVTGHRPLSEAIITAGGVDTREVNPRTMESRLIKGLFMAGELLDVHADTGGYNLQAAFSTGWLAGRCAATD
ncbi:MAG: NAD(P)/FAD-dependent oxidoreductase [Desulfobacteraceae bacterium]